MDAQVEAAPDNKASDSTDEFVKQSRRFRGNVSQVCISGTETCTTCGNEIPLGRALRADIESDFFFTNICMLVLMGDARCWKYMEHQDSRAVQFAPATITIQYGAGALQ